MWDFNIQTDHVIQHRRPDIHVLSKTKRKCHLVDIAVPGDRGIELKEQEKVDNYSELCKEVKKIWNLSQVVVVPVAKSSIAYKCTNCKASPTDLRLLDATCFLGNIPELPTKPT